MLSEKGRQIEAIVKGTRGVADVKMEQASGIPQLQDRDRQAGPPRAYGVSVGAISEVVKLAVGGEELTQLWKNQRSYGVFVRYPDEMRGDPEAIGNLMVDTPSGAQVPALAGRKGQPVRGPNMIWHEAMSRRLSIDANLQGRDLGSVVSDIKDALAKVELPPDYFVVFGGQYQNQQRAMKSLLLATGVAAGHCLSSLYMASGIVSRAGNDPCHGSSAFIGGVAIAF